MGSLLKRHIRAKCWDCTEKFTGDRNAEQGCEREWSLVRAFFHIPGRKPENMDAWECGECGALVPTDTWQVYLQTGDIVVKHDRNRTERKYRR